METHLPPVRARRERMPAAPGNRLQRRDVREGQSKGTASLCHSLLLLYSSSNISPVWWHDGRATLQPSELQRCGEWDAFPNVSARSFHPGMGEALTSGGLSGKYGSLLKIFSLSHIQATSWAEPCAPQESNE